jgi:hypothetical protein
MDLSSGGHDGIIATIPNSITTRGRGRGPAMLSYLPREFQHIPGVQTITTPKQLERLAEYTNTANHLRKPFIRLGCSVRHGRHGRPTTTSSTYAVTIDGTVEVLRFDDMDPRSAHKYVRGAGRAWNISPAFASGPKGDGGDSSIPTLKTYVVRADEPRHPRIRNRAGRKSAP